MIPTERAGGNGENYATKADLDEAYRILARLREQVEQQGGTTQPG
jgi:hypothetical protein